MTKRRRRPLSLEPIEQASRDELEDTAHAARRTANQDRFYTYRRTLDR